MTSSALVFVVGCLSTGIPRPSSDTVIEAPSACNVTSIELAMRRDNATTYPLEFRAIWYDLATSGEEMGVYEAEDGTT